jgi:hypothetical protein
VARRGDLISGTRDRHLTIVTLWFVNHEPKRERARSRRCPGEGFDGCFCCARPLRLVSGRSDAFVHLAGAWRTSRKGRRKMELRSVGVSHRQEGSYIFLLSRFDC